MRLRHGFGLIVVVCGLWGCNSSVQAGFEVFTTESAYNSATTANSTPIDFENLVADHSFLNVAFSGDPGVTIDGVNFAIDASTSSSTLFEIGKDYYYSGNSILSAQYYNTSTDLNIVVTLPVAATAFGIDLGSFNTTADPLTITLSSGETFLASAAAYPGLSFVGFATDKPFTSFKISDVNSAISGGVLNADNFRFGSRVVPAPSSLALLIIGGVGALGQLRRRNKRYEA